MVNMNQSTLKDAETALIALDPLLGALISRQKVAPLAVPTDYFIALCRSIIGQQVSTAAASAIFGRFQTATDSQPKKVLALDENRVKEIGLSRQKLSYLQDLAGHFYKNSAVYDHLGDQANEQVIDELTAIKGIGEWTAQMFLIFTLHRPDVFAPKDGGLQRAMQNLYGWETIPPAKELEALAFKWSPYRSVASLHLWHSLDNSPNNKN